jgi:Cdc6-like AAA superfamily ATPase
LHTTIVVVVMRKKDSDRGLLLRDEPIETEDLDRFKHSIFVEVLFDLISEVENSCTIGLFGKWGSGKTSIVKMLFNKMRNDKKLAKTTKCLYIDLWKYSSESWRTDFLIEFDRGLGGHVGKDVIIDTLYNIHEEEIRNTDEKLTDRFWDFLANLKVFWIFSFGIVVADILFYLFTDIEIANIVTASVTVPLVAELISKINSWDISMKKRIILPKREWTGEFESLFSKIVANSKAKRIVVAIDNLDRCESKTLMQVLSQLRTFMDFPKCIYIIPCDEEAVLSHIAASNKEVGYFTRNGQEFLRKVFQVMIRIPPFLPGSLEEYVQNLRLNVRFPSDENVQDVIVSAHAKNPRRIIHAYNRLTTLYLLARKKEQMNLIRKGIITDNLLFLAKISIIEEEWKDFYRDLAQNSFLLDEVEDFFRNVDLDKDDMDLINLHFEKSQELKEFLNATRIIRTEDVKPFLLLNQEVYESAIHELEQFKACVMRNNVDEVKDILGRISDAEKVNYVKTILKWCSEAVQCKRFSKGFNCLNVVCHIYDLLPDELHSEVAKECGGYLDRKEIVQFLPSFDVEQLFKILPHMPLATRDNVMSSLVDSFFLRDCKDGLFLKKLMERSDLVGRAPRKRLNDLLNDGLNSKVAEVATGVIRTITQNETAVRDLLDQKTLSGIIDCIGTEDASITKGQIINKKPYFNSRKSKGHPRELEVRVQTFFGNLRLETTVEISSDALIEELIKRAAADLRLDPQECALMFGGEKLPLDMSLREAGIGNNNLVGLIPSSW